MPWYMSPTTTCKVLNRIANRHQRAPLRDLTTLLNHATEKLWSKQERYYEKQASHRMPFQAVAATKHAHDTIQSAVHFE